MKEYTVPENTTLAVFTDNVCAQASFCMRALLKERNVRVNGVRVSSDVPLKKGDVVRYYMSSAQQTRRAFCVVYEDDNVIVADKESGVNSEAVFSELSERGKTFFIHRLDRNTEGLMIFAKNEASETELLSAFRERRVQKVYLARVVGTPSPAHACKGCRVGQSACRCKIGRRKNCDGIRSAGVGRDVTATRNASYGKDAPDPRASRLYRTSRRRG